MKAGGLKQKVAGRSHPVLAITQGDMNGIGPEVILKNLSDLSNSTVSSSEYPGVLLFASRTVMEYYAKALEIPAVWQVTDSAPYLLLDSQSASDSHMPRPEPGQIFLVPLPEPAEPVQPGVISPEAGSLAMRAIASAVDACLAGRADALITAPISKEAIHKAGYRVPGHTEYLAQLTRSTGAGMMLVNRVMRIGLATIHIPLCEVPKQLTEERIESRLLLFHQALQRDFGIAEPRIAVLGLNPHAGDGGVLGREERLIITPVIEKLRKQNMTISGPWPADGFFGHKGFKDADLVFAMYHDQGLIPLKMADFGNGVNVTVGLPIIRTSPDHGTAFSIAGKSKADAGSMLAAIRLAVSMTIRRKSA